jgi:hypothetical protein
MVSGIDVFGVYNLREAYEFLTGEQPLLPMREDLTAYFSQHQDESEIDFADVRGNSWPPRGRGGGGRRAQSAHIVVEMTTFWARRSPGDLRLEATRRRPKDDGASRHPGKFFRMLKPAVTRLFDPHSRPMEDPIQGETASRHGPPASLPERC